MNTTEIILASSSEGRRKLLKQLKLNFSTFSPDIDESPLANESHHALSLRLAESKALHCAQSLKRKGLYIGSDQVASLNNGEHSIQLNKPYTAEKALSQLMQCQGKTVTFYTGLCLYNAESENKQSAVTKYSVTFRQLNQTQLEHYIQIDQPLHCAGSFKMEALGISLFERMEGNDPNSLIGLPLIMLCDFLKKEGHFPV